MREINYLVSAQSITPSSVQEAGFQCEYNATKVIFTLEDALAEQLASQTDRQLWTVEVGDAEGNIKIYPVELKGSKAEFVLPTEITMSGSTASLQLVVTTVDENYIMLKRQCFSVVKIKFGQSVASLVDSNEYDRYSHNLVGAMSLAVDAAQVASQSAELSQTASERAIDAAARAEEAVKEEWQLLMETEFEKEVTMFSQKVDGLGPTEKGVRAALYLPPNTTLPSNRIAYCSSLSGSNAIEIYINDWVKHDTESVCVVETRPKGLLWNVEVLPYTKGYKKILNDISVVANSKVRYLRFEGPTLPIGTKIKIWGLV